ncbi:MAG: D-2-hydroxyacid dehydrogenase [Verrucomicrobiota bacterium]
MLDAHTTSALALGERSSHHPSWDPLTALADLTLHPRTAPEEILERAQSAEALLTNKVLLPKDILTQLPQLKYLGIMATGTNNVDLAAARAQGIDVTNVPGYSTESVAQHVFALLLEMAGNISGHTQSVREGAWVASPDFAYTLTPFIELAGKKLGVLGFGAIGQAVARVGYGLGMEVLVSSRTEKPAPFPVRWVDRETLLAEADAVSLHCALTPDTQHLINAESVQKMKPTAWLINTGRGPLVDEAALATALGEGKIAGYATDVLSAEPARADNPLLTAPRTWITPHLAWASVEARHRLMATLAANLQAWQNGTPQNVVN